MKAKSIFDDNNVNDGFEINYRKKNEIKVGYKLKPGQSKKKNKRK